VIYKFRCGSCGEEEDIHASIHEHTNISSRIFCQCGGIVLQVLESAMTVFPRTGFPRNAVHEHIADKPIKLKDKKHFQDVANQNGWTTSWFDGI